MKKIIVFGCLLIFCVSPIYAKESKNIKPQATATALFSLNTFGEVDEQKLAEKMMKKQLRDQNLKSPSMADSSMKSRYIEAMRKAENK